MWVRYFFSTLFLIFFTYTIFRGVHEKNSIFVLFYLLSYGVSLLSSDRAVEGQSSRPKMEHKSTQTDVVPAVDPCVAEQRRQRQLALREAVLAAGNSYDGLSSDVSR